jgi:hypothetical protein
VNSLGDAKDSWLWFRYIPNCSKLASALDVGCTLHTYQVKSTPKSLDNRTRACLIRATPPPCGVLLKKAILVFNFFNAVTKCIIAFHVVSPQVFLKSSRERMWALLPESISTTPL